VKRINICRDDEEGRVDLIVCFCEIWGITRSEDEERLTRT
jgi:hypothetical protein